MKLKFIKSLALGLVLIIPSVSHATLISVSTDTVEDLDKPITWIFSNLEDAVSDVVFNLFAFGDLAYDNEEFLDVELTSLTEGTSLTVSDLFDTPIGFSFALCDNGLACISGTEVFTVSSTVFNSFGGGFSFTTLPGDGVSATGGDYAQLSFSYESAAVSVDVPEPGTIFMVGAMLLGAIRLTRRV